MLKKTITMMAMIIALAYLSPKAGIYISRYVDGWRMQEAQLKDVSISVKPKGSYLEITEDAVIGTSGATGDARDYIDGSIELPAKSTITAFYLSNDTGLYAARLQPLGSSDSTVDTTRGRLIASIQADIPQQRWYYDIYGSLQCETINPFKLRIDSIANRNEYRVVLKYLVPNSGNPNADYQLSVALHSATQHPGVFELTYSADSTAPRCVLNVSNMKFQLTNNQSIQVQYQQWFSIKVQRSEPSTMQLTQFTENSWKGHYLLLNTSIPDTVLQQLGIPIEVAVLWRWNQPGTFVDDYGSIDEIINKRLNYGYQAISQAEAIKSLCREITSTGNKIGMIHSVQTRKTEVFPMCKKNSSALDRLESYLGQFTYEYFMNNDFFSHKVSSDLPGDIDSSALRDSSGKEFITNFKLAHALYSNDKGVLKHLIILSSGPARMSRNLITLEEIDTMLNGLTIDCENVSWTDVPFTVLKSKVKKDSLVDWGSFRIPEYLPHSLLLNISSQSKSYSFPLSPDQASFSIIAKSEGTWNPLFTWKGYDRFGQIMNTATSTASVFTADKDTGLVKLWASNNERLNDKRESEIDKNYGVISQIYGLKVYPSYVTYGKDLASYAAVDLTYTDKTSIEKFRKIINLQKNSALHCTWSQTGLHVAVPAGEHIRRICIFSLSGKLLIELNPANYQGVGGYLFPARLFNKTISSGNVVVIRIEGMKKVWSKQMIFKS